MTDLGASLEFAEGTDSAFGQNAGPGVEDSSSY